MGRIRDGQDGRVPPEAVTGEDRRAAASQDIEVISHGEQAAALGALEPIVEGVGGAALDADERARQ